MAPMAAAAPMTLANTPLQSALLPAGEGAAGSRSRSYGALQADVFPQDSSLGLCAGKVWPKGECSTSATWRAALDPGAEEASVIEPRAPRAATLLTSSPLVGTLVFKHALLRGMSTPLDERLSSVRGPLMFLSDDCLPIIAEPRRAGVPLLRTIGI
mmetsp:Transcript_138144/g.429434  ORF Transcript_138144/g.429434 Transcript_138144/m.429434 type:complete len:156 (-) Transcript_138144:230-697(-)